MPRKIKPPHHYNHTFRVLFFFKPKYLCYYLSTEKGPRDYFKAQVLLFKNYIGTKVSEEKYLWDLLIQCHDTKCESSTQYDQSRPRSDLLTYDKVSLYEWPSL